MKKKKFILALRINENPWNIEKNEDADADQTTREIRPFFVEYFSFSPSLS